jgi:hypothetical protein
VSIYGNYKSLNRRPPLVHEDTSNGNKPHATDPLIAGELHKKVVYVTPVTDPYYNIKLESR